MMSPAETFFKSHCEERPGFFLVRIFHSRLDEDYTHLLDFKIEYQEEICSIKSFLCYRLNSIRCLLNLLIDSHEGLSPHYMGYPDGYP